MRFISVGEAATVHVDHDAVGHIGVARGHPVLAGRHHRFGRAISGKREVALAQAGQNGEGGGTILGGGRYSGDVHAAVVSGRSKPGNRSTALEGGRIVDHSVIQADGVR
jgi:hypothetical protein